MTKQLLIVEDEAPVARAVSLLLAGTAWSPVIAPTAEAARMWLARRQFACILMDLFLPDGAGVDLIAMAKQMWPAVPILVLTSAHATPVVEAALRAGAGGYLLKEDLAGRLLPALAEVSAGAMPLSARVAGPLIAAALQQPRPIEANSAPPSNRTPLTEREYAVLRGLAAGLSYAAIAKAQGVSVNTVRSHVRAVYDKLGVHNRTQALIAAARLT